MLSRNLESDIHAPRVVAADLDGTLLPLRVDGSQELTPLTIASVRVLNRLGIPTILVTGRMFRSAARYARDLGIEGPVAAYQGAMIREVGTSRLLHHDPVPLNLALEIIEVVDPHDCTMNLYVDDKLYVESINEAIERYERISGTTANAVGRLSTFLHEPPTKIGLSAAPELVETVLPQLKSHFADRLNIVRTWPFFLEVTNLTATKARALAFLGSVHGFRAEEVLAFGDSCNDMDMLMWAGTGVAMGGAPAEVIASADVVCEPVGEDGFARYLTRQPWFPSNMLEGLA